MADINPYRAPEATVLEETPGSGNLAQEPNSVDVARSIAWLVEGWQNFRQAPLVWIAICILSIVAIMVLALIPVIGQLTTTLLTVVLAGGIMLGCRAMDRGEDLTVAHMLAGLQNHTAPLLTIGALYLAGIFLLIVSVGLISGGTMFALIQGGVQPGMALTSIVLALALSGLIVVPLAMSIWFAPALATLHDLPPIEAMKLSFRGCLRNWLPFLVYGVITFVLALIATMPFGLGWLVLMPVLAGSVYAGYKDIFIQA